MVRAPVCAASVVDPQGRDWTKSAEWLFCADGDARDVGLCGAWGRNRTGTGFPPRDFRTTAAFAAACQGPCICGLDFTFAIPCRSRPARIRQGPSSLYTFLGGARLRGAEVDNLLPGKLSTPTSQMRRPCNPSNSNDNYEQVSLRRSRSTASKEPRLSSVLQPP